MSAYVVMAWLDPESWEPCAVFDHEPSTLEAAREAIRCIREHIGREQPREAFSYHNVTDRWDNVFAVREIKMALDSTFWIAATDADGVGRDGA